MEKYKSFLFLTFLTLVLFVSNRDAVRSKGVCSWLSHQYSTCFPCLNRRKCIERKMRCDGVDDCGDSSDEYNCERSSGSCSSNNWRRCLEYGPCIPVKWICNGVPDCPNGFDEKDCGQDFAGYPFSREKTNYTNHVARIKAVNWILTQRNTEVATEMWGPLADKVAVALYLTSNFSEDVRNETRKELAYETSIQLLSQLSKKSLEDIDSTDLASYVNSFLVTCVDPRKFHGLDIIQELRSRVDRENNTNPYVLLALCNAGVIITESDQQKLLNVYRTNQRSFWTDIQAGVLMAFACASKQPGSDITFETLSDLAFGLKMRQYSNGTVENLQTTALVMQALLSAEPDSDAVHFDEMKALQQIMGMQRSDGSFGNFMNTYYVLPVLNCMSLVNISADHCESYYKDEIFAIDDLVNRSGPKIRVQYSLWIGKDKDEEINLALRVPANTSFYGVMELAADVDSRYRFEYIVKNKKPYVNALSELQDNPEKGKFWYLYVIVDGKPYASQQSPADIIPKENDHFVMWYRRGSWINR